MVTPEEKTGMREVLVVEVVLVSTMTVTSAGSDSVRVVGAVTTVWRERMATLVRVAVEVVRMEVSRVVGTRVVWRAVTMVQEVKTVVTRVKTWYWMARTV